MGVAAFLAVVRRIYRCGRIGGEQGFGKNAHPSASAASERGHTSLQFDDRALPVSSASKPRAASPCLRMSDLSLVDGRGMQPRPPCLLQPRGSGIMSPLGSVCLASGFTSQPSLTRTRVLSVWGSLSRRSTHFHSLGTSLTSCPKSLFGQESQSSAQT
jgi:hypothetical protein